MIPSQMLKGVLEGCVLAIIAQNETYGYEISQQLEHYGFGKSQKAPSIPCSCVWKKTAAWKPSTVPLMSAQSANTTTSPTLAAKNWPSL